jgi:hypothetical protein
MGTSASGGVRAFGVALERLLSARSLPFDQPPLSALQRHSQPWAPDRPVSSISKSSARCRMARVDPLATFRLDRAMEHRGETSAVDTDPNGDGGKVRRCGERANAERLQEVYCRGVVQLG